MVMAVNTVTILPTLTAVTTANTVNTVATVTRKSKIGWELTKNGGHVRSPGLKNMYIYSFQTNYPYCRGFYACFLGF